MGLETSARIPDEYPARRIVYNPTGNTKSLENHETFVKDF